ncbi:hypothetical protein [Hyalangium versicolor]|uniref:hypothetical protein n=1 Tax=Hyalangium versicolor TaxID=2861190 RepID=UPI001CC948B7|nr:hypothetical protein [Hyalangium versicolor]
MLAKHLKSVAAFFSFCFLLVANSAWAQSMTPVRITSISVPSSMGNPLNGFTLNYTLAGFNYYGLGAAINDTYFYLSKTPDGSSGAYLLLRKGILLTNNGAMGPYYAPSGTLSATVTQADMDPNTVAVLQDIVTGCQPQSWYILGYTPQISLVSKPSTLGGYNSSDLFFTAGALSPSVIQPGGTTNISFTLFRQCPGNTPSTVGIYLADANYQLLSFIGSVSIPGGAGASTLPPSGITFSSAIPLGTYRIVMFADDAGVVSEVNENNNVSSFTLQVVSGVRSALKQDAASLETEVTLPAPAASMLRGRELGPSMAHLEATIR